MRAECPPAHLCVPAVTREPRCDGSRMGGNRGRGRSPSFTQLLQASGMSPTEGEQAPRSLWTNSDAQTSRAPERSRSPGLCETCEFHVARSQRVWFHEGGDAPAGDFPWAPDTHLPGGQECRWARRAARKGGGQEIYGKPARVTKEMTSCTARGGHPREEQRRGTQGDPSIPEPSVNTRQKAQSRGGICGRRGALGRVEEPQAPGESGSPAFFPWEEVIHHPD